jgi:hypothetical protein
MNELDQSIREFTPEDGNWLPLETLFEQAFSSSDPRQFYPAIFNLFERFPDDDGSGVFWSAVHGMEATGEYEDLLLQYFRRHPSLMTRTLLSRMKNAGENTIGGIQITDLIET